MDLAQLINQRRGDGAGTLRDMVERASQTDYPIGRSTLSEYAKGLIKRYPNEKTMKGLAAALDVSLETVEAAAVITASPKLGNEIKAVDVQHVQAWVDTIAPLTEQQVKQLMGVVRAAVLAMGITRDETRGG